MVPRNLVAKEGGKDIWQMYLVRTVKIAFTKFEILRHHAEGCVFWTENVPGLAQHFRHPNIGPHVARSVISGKQQF